MLWPLLAQINPSNDSNITGFYSQVLEDIVPPNPRETESRKVEGKHKACCISMLPMDRVHRIDFPLSKFVVLVDSGQGVGSPAQHRTQTTKFSLDYRRPLAHGKRNASPFWESCNPQRSPLRKAESSESAARAVRGIDCGQLTP